MTESALSLPCLAGLSAIAAVPDILEGAMKQAADMGIGTTQNASCSQAVNTAICMSTDFKNAGAVVAERLAKELNGQGNVVVGFGAPDDANHKLRQDGLEEYFAANAPGIKVIGVMTNCDDPAGTVKCAEDALAAYPEMNAYYSTGNLSGVGAAQVFPKAGRDDIIITAVDDAPEVMDAIKNNPKMFTYVQQPFGQGYLAVYIPWLMKNKGLKPNIKYLDTGITIVDQSNLENYQDTMMEKYVELKKQVDEQIMK
jgi:ribose transport system substrate-binding protein